jgi:carbonic anhydrase/acetyltransferase-like protein (isoleucine patch superfamily)
VAPRIHPTAFVATGAVVVGDVTLGAGASVWFNTVVRGDSAPIVVGEETNLQDNGVVHVDEGQPAVLGARVTVGHRVVVHGCVVEDDCLIGMGSVLLTGARVGKGSLIGAASLVREGQEIPAGSLALGAPARVVGPVGPAHVEAIRNGASHYAELASIYRGMGFAKPADRGGAVVHDARPGSAREWEALVDALEAAPGLLARRTPLAEGSRLAALFGWLSRTDRDVRLPLVRRLRAGEEAPLPPTAPAAAGGGPPERLETWNEARRELCRALRPLGPGEWARLAADARRGPLTLFDLLREWVEEDLERRREAEAGGLEPRA